MSDILDRLAEMAQLAEDENYNPTIYHVFIDAINSESTVEELAEYILTLPLGDIM